MQDLSLYFDYAAATPLNPKSLSAMQPYFTEEFYNPSAIYIKSINVKKVLKTAKTDIAKELGCLPSEVVLTAGGTEANNLAIRGVMQKWPGKNLIVSAIEHESVLEPAKLFRHKIAPVNKKGITDLVKLKGLIDKDTVLVSVMMANNEIGTIQPVREIANLLAEVKANRLKTNNKTPIFLHTDACQAINYLDISTKRLGVDLMTINSGKVYGPKQTGALFIRGGLIFEPIIYGGGQEGGLRSGTENVANAVGFAKSLQLVRQKSKTETKRLTELRDYLAKRLTDELDGLEINGTGGSKRLANNLNITIPNIDNERFLMELDELGIMIATGSACSASSEEPSHVLKAIGKTEQEIFSSIRITLGQYTTKQGIDKLISAIKEILAKK